MADFETTINAAIQNYSRELKDDLAHPFPGTIPARWRLNVWAVVMGKQGHQIPHTHPSACLSGVYYASTPDDIRADDPAHAGWIEFGPPDAAWLCKTDPHKESVYEFAESQAPLVERIRPEEGLCVLFPSYFYHNTVPYGGAGTRISIAFDVIEV